MVAAANARGVSQIGERGVVAGVAEKRPVICRQLGQRRVAPRRNRQQVGPVGFSGRSRSVRSLLQDDVSVGPAEAERAYTRATRQTRRFPALPLGCDRKRRVFERDQWIEPLEMQVARDESVEQAERGLDHAGDTGGRLQMTEIGFHCPQSTRRLVLAWRSENRRQGLDLDRVAQRRARAVTFNKSDPFRLKAVRSPRLGAAGLPALARWARSVRSTPRPDSRQNRE